MNPTERIRSHLGVFNRRIDQQVLRFETEASWEVAPGVEVATRSPSETRVILGNDQFNGLVLDRLQEEGFGRVLLPVLPKKVVDPSFASRHPQLARAAKSPRVHPASGRQCQRMLVACHDLCDLSILAEKGHVDGNRQGRVLDLFSCNGVLVRVQNLIQVRLG